jgi:hypothetical protein
MDREDIIKLARETGLVRTGDKWVEPARWGVTELVNFAALVAAAEREKVARWQIGSGYTTGHGDTIEDLLVELEWQVRESEREACAKVCDGMDHNGVMIAADCAAAIRARGNK